MTKQQLSDKIPMYLSIPTRKRAKPSKTLVDTLTLNAARFMTFLPGDTIPEGHELRQMLDGFIASLGVQRSTARQILGVMGGYFKWLGIITPEAYSELTRRYNSPMVKWSDKAIDDNEQVELLKRLSGNHNWKNYADIRDYVIGCVLLTMGFRRRQICDLRKEDVTWNDEVVTFNISTQKNVIIEKRKKPMPIKIVMPDGVRFEEIFMRYVYHPSRPQSEWFFPTGTGRALLPRAIRRIITEKTGMEVTPHQLRHTAGTRVANTVGIVNAALLLDHSNITTTQNYVQLSRIDVGEVVRKSLEGK